MHAMVAFVTDDFHLSAWTMQEVGYALGRGIPCLSVTFQPGKPPGFLEQEQSLHGDLQDPSHYALKLAGLLADASGRRSNIQSALIVAFLNAPSARQARDRLTALREFAEQLNEAEIGRLLEAINGKAVLQKAFFQREKDARRVITFFKNSSGRSFELAGSKLIASDPDGGK